MTGSIAVTVAERGLAVDRGELAEQRAGPADGQHDLGAAGGVAPRP